MESNPALGLLGFWMMLQLAASLALLVGGIYVMFCLGRAASGLDRLANAMEDWVALQSASARPIMPQQPGGSFDLTTPSSPAPNPVPFIPTSAAPTQPYQSQSE